MPISPEQGNPVEVRVIEGPCMGLTGKVLGRKGEMVEVHPYGVPPSVHSVGFHVSQLTQLDQIPK